MSVHMIYYKDGAKMMRPVLTAAEYRNLRNGQRSLVAAIRQGDTSLKQRLIQMNYSCLPNDDGSLKGSTRLSNTVGMDIDHIAQDQMEATKERILAKKDELGLLMLELSARGEGYHLVFRRRPSMSQEENLRWASRLLGVEYDKGAKDITRVFFTTSASAEDLIYLDDEIFQTNPTPLLSPEGEERNLSPTLSKGEGEVSPWGDLEGVNPSPRGGQEGVALCFRGIPYSEIVREYWNRTGGTPVEGERNVRLHQLAVNLRAICDNKKEVLMQIMPRLGLSETELQSIVDSACKEPPKGISRVMREILENEKMRNGENEDLSPALSQGEGEKCSMVNGQSSMFNGQSPLPKRLPKLIKLLTSKTPDIYKPAVAHAVFPPLATHLCNVRFRYTDNVEHEATLMNCLMATTGAGKGCTDEPIARIMADIKLRDKENERREAEWKKDCQKKGANKDKLLRPEGLVIQIIDPDMTKPALVTRMDEAEGHFVYVKLNELDLFEQLKGQTGKQHFQLMCLAFDPGAEYGQTRVGTQSVTARPQCRFNWNASTTIVKGRRFFRNVLTDGPISRINFCTIPEQEIGCEQPIYGTYDAGFDEQLRPYIENLVNARGLIDCPQAFRLAKRLQQECAEFARLSQSETYWNLSHRACVIAWLKACVLYVANGQKWESAIEDFVRWSLNYDLWCKMQFFGEDIEKANRENNRIGKRGPRNLLELLPHEFTIEDAKRVRREQGLSNEGNLCRQMISQWAFRKYVLQITDYSFVKNKK